MSGRQLNRRQVYLGKQKEVLGSSAHAFTSTHLPDATFSAAAMDLPSTSYVSQSAKLPFSWSNSGELLAEHVGRNGEERPLQYSSRSPEIKSDDMDSVYSDAGDTFASRPCNNGYENHEGVASPRRTDVNARDFILRRFLPAAQAMASEGSSSATSTFLASDQRHLRDSEVLSCGRAVPMLPPPSKSRFAQEVKQDVQYDSGDDEVDEMRACGFPLRLGRLSLRHLRYGFGTSRSSSRSRSPPKRTKTVAQKKVQEEGSVDSDDLFWSDEEYFDNEEGTTTTPADLISDLEGFSELKTAIQSDTVRIVEVNKGATSEGFVQVRTLPARLHSMHTVHTPDHKGFLGMPKTSGLSGESEKARQVDRLGARLTHMISKANYVEPRSMRVNEHDEIEGSSQGPSATSSSSAEFPKARWVDKVSAMGALMPPPSPKCPTESWLCNTLPSSRFLATGARKSSRKPLGSYIPIKTPVKASPQSSREEVPKHQGASLQQICSLKEHTQGRQVFSSTAQAV